ncbi:MAG: class 1 fructose-bisphosphatase [Candidatus Dadabacteria bacterium]|nr:MAG: class 1 fructose-bisphosphatase [Candidatus Dadabacteria bacterium]
MIPTITLNRFIRQEEKAHPYATGELTDLLYSIGLAVKMISHLVATAGYKGLHGYTDKVNIQGEIVHKLDQEADEILMEILSSCGHFGSLVSEERDQVVTTPFESKVAKYAVAFDPLDGSSNIGSNIPVGTIFTVFKRKTPEEPPGIDDMLQPGRNVVAAGYAVYGSMTSFVYTCGSGVHGFTLDPEIGEFVLTEEEIKIPESGSIYSVNEGYWELWDDKTRDAVRRLKESDNPLGKPYTSRYVGSLVSDFDRTLRRGGIFLHPANKKRERGKLRLLYECIPLSYIAHVAGGIGTDGSVNVIDIEPKSIHERCPLIIGSKKEVEWFLEILNNNQ